MIRAVFKLSDVSKILIQMLSIKMTIHVNSSLHVAKGVINNKKIGILYNSIM